MKNKLLKISLVIFIAGVISLTVFAAHYTKQSTLSSSEISATGPDELGEHYGDLATQKAKKYLKFLEKQQKALNLEIETIKDSLKARRISQ